MYIVASTVHILGAMCALYPKYKNEMKISTTELPIDCTRKLLQYLGCRQLIFILRPVCESREKLEIGY